MWIDSRTVGATLVLVTVACLCGPARADTTLRYQVARKDGSAPMVVKLQPGAVRIEGAPVVGRFEYMVYRSADDTLYAVSTQAETVLALNSEGIAAVQKRMSAMRERLRERLKHLPADKRRFIKKQIGDLLEPSTDPGDALRVEMTDKKTRVADVACRTARIMAHGTAVGELCVASVSALGLKAAAFDAYQGLYRLINGLRSAVVGESDMPNFATLGGVPVRVRLDYSQVSKTLQEMTHAPLADDVFAIPEGYQRKRATDILKKAPTTARGRAQTAESG